MVFFVMCFYMMVLQPLYQDVLLPWWNGTGSSSAGNQVQPAAPGGAPAKPPGAAGAAPSRPPGATGAAPAKPPGATGAAPARPPGAAGAAPAKPPGAAGAAPARPPGAAGAAPARPPGAAGAAPAKKTPDPKNPSLDPKKKPDSDSKPGGGGGSGGKGPGGGGPGGPPGAGAAGATTSQGGANKNQAGGRKKSSIYEQTYLNVDEKKEQEMKNKKDPKKRPTLIVTGDWSKEDLTKPSAPEDLKNDTLMSIKSTSESNVKVKEYQKKGKKKYPKKRSTLKVTGSRSKVDLTKPIVPIDLTIDKPKKDPTKPVPEDLKNNTLKSIKSASVSRTRLNVVNSSTYFNTKSDNDFTNIALMTLPFSLFTTSNEDLPVAAASEESRSASIIASNVHHISSNQVKNIFPEKKPVPIFIVSSDTCETTTFETPSKGIIKKTSLPIEQSNDSQLGFESPSYSRAHLDSEGKSSSDVYSFRSVMDQVTSAINTITSNKSVPDQIEKDSNLTAKKSSSKSVSFPKESVPPKPVPSIPSFYSCKSVLVNVMPVTNTRATQVDLESNIVQNPKKKRHHKHGPKPNLPPKNEPSIKKSEQRLTKSKKSKSKRHSMKKVKTNEDDNTSKIVENKIASKKIIVKESLAASNTENKLYYDLKNPTPPREEIQFSYEVNAIKIDKAKKKEKPKSHKSRTGLAKAAAYVSKITLLSNMEFNSKKSTDKSKSALKKKSRVRLVNELMDLPSTSKAKKNKTNDDTQKAISTTEVKPTQVEKTLSGTLPIPHNSELLVLKYFNLRKFLSSTSKLFSYSIQSSSTETQNQSKSVLNRTTPSNLEHLKHLKQSVSQHQKLHKDDDVD